MFHYITIALARKSRWRGADGAKNSGHGNGVHERRAIFGLGGNNLKMCDIFINKRFSIKKVFLLKKKLINFIYNN